MAEQTCLVPSLQRDRSDAWAVPCTFLDDGQTDDESVPRLVSRKTQKCSLIEFPPNSFTRRWKSSTFGVLAE